MNKGNWLMLTGDNCQKCNYFRVDLYENGEEICEKCGHSQK